MTMNGRWPTCGTITPERTPGHIDLEKLSEAVRSICQQLGAIQTRSIDIGNKSQKLQEDFREVVYDIARIGPMTRKVANTLLMLENENRTLAAAMSQQDKRWQKWARDRESSVYEAFKGWEPKPRQAAKKPKKKAKRRKVKK
jgi:thioesterase domain-containing protein